MKSSRNIPVKIAVVGLGKLGSPMAAAVAARGIAVIGVDMDPDKVDRINHGQPPVNETDLAKYIRLGRKRLSATTDIEKAAASAEIIFVIVPTPSESHGGFSLRHVLPACERIGRALAGRKDFPVVVITATVMPGSTGGPVRECLERHSGKTTGKDFGLCYSPEFIALGNVIHGFLNPDFILCGESDLRSGRILDAFYRKVCENRPHIAHMNFANAELSKLAVNTFVTTKITYANMLARICEHMPGGDVDVVTSAIGHDTRIGVKYLKGAAGYGGPCFPRDNLAMSALARGFKVQAALAETTDRENRAEVRRMEDLVVRHARRGTRIGILGLSYKPDTDVVEESQGVMLARSLLKKRYSLWVADPMALDSARSILGNRPTYCADAEECVRQTDVIVIVVPWKEFRRIPAAAFGREKGRPVLVDVWRIAPDSWRRMTTYIPKGVFLPAEGRETGAR
jgi:UDPglucose 6-dehydrogenase